MEETSNQMLLLQALKNDDIGSFQRLLTYPDVSSTHRYTGPKDWGTCLEIACRLRKKENFVQLLLTRYKVKPNINEILPEPIHFAAKYGNIGALKHLLRDKRTRVNAQDSCGRTALHHVAKNFTENPSNYEQCLELLLSRPDVDVNRPNKNNCTAIREAAEFSGRQAVVAIIRMRIFDLDLDSHRGHGKTARQVILDKFPDLEPMLPPPPIKTEIHNSVIRELQCGNYENVRKLLDSIESNSVALLSMGEEKVKLEL